MTTTKKHLKQHIKNQDNLIRVLLERRQLESQQLKDLSRTIAMHISEMSSKYQLKQITILGSSDQERLMDDHMVTIALWHHKKERRAFDQQLLEMIRDAE